ncbi:phosphotransferase [Streptomyces sp. NPDC004539]|uniref:phosphotransferase family protein n=1 Tax=Streptomyces sp. NPDC004539 TaxID=3154280 RepID=UPI00339FA4F2
MKPTAPPATGIRTPWESLPAFVQDGVAAILGAVVGEARTQRGGFSPGVAARVVTVDGRRAFVKAVSGEANAFSPVLHRREAGNAGRLPVGVPAPRLIGVYDDGVWVALVFEDVQGVQPQVPWDDGEFGVVLDAVHRLGQVLTPAPFDAPCASEELVGTFDGWQELADRGEPVGFFAELASSWPDAVRGDTLAHGDLRADNILIGEDNVWFVDWPHAMRAAPWFDLLLLLPSVRAQGGPDPEEVFTRHPLGCDADQGAVTVALAGLAGYFLNSASKPAPPGLPTLRPFQRAQGDAALEWLRRRVG